MRNYSLPLLLTLALMAASCRHVDVDFTYSPEMPKAGDTVRFTNLSDGGEHWNWTFGDGSLSTSKDPIKIYKQPGTYTVTLRVDSTSRFTVSKQVVVYDTVPQIACTSDSLLYFHTSYFYIQAYNPTGSAVSCRWQFSENARSDSLDLDGTSAASVVPVCFTRANVTEQVTCIVRIGSHAPDTLTASFYIHDQQARSLLMAADGKLWRQRLYSEGMEEPVEMQLIQPANPSAIAARSNRLYVFERGTDQAADGQIRVADMASGRVETVVANKSTEAALDFFGGCVGRDVTATAPGNDRIYWLDQADHLYSAPVSLRNAAPATADDFSAYLLASVKRLGYYGNGLSEGQANGGFSLYGNLCLWGKQGTGRGIYTFYHSDILAADLTSAGTPPSTGVLLPDRAVRSFAVDPMHLKVYFIDAEGNVGVAGMDGSQVNIFATNATGSVLVDNYTDCVYWTTADGVFAARLSVTTSNLMDAPVLLNPLPATCLTIDEVVK